MLEGRVGNKNLFDFLTANSAGEIAGVFSSGIYFTVSGKMLLLHDASYGVLPFGISVMGLAGKAKGLGIEPGMTLRLDENTVSCDSADTIIRFAYEESTERPGAINDIQMFAQKAEHALKVAGKSVLAVYCTGNISGLDKNSIEDIFAKTAYSGLSELEFAMSKCDTASIEPALKKLIGLGRGLTPALDDFICGMLFLLHYVRRVWSFETHCLDALCRSVEKLAPERSNAYSAAYLLSAAAGEDFSLMRNCVEAAAYENARESLDKLMNVGASSGSDMLCGMCFASNYILKQRQFTL